jgi:hypothetical protein
MYQLSKTYCSKATLHQASPKDLPRLRGEQGKATQVHNRPDQQIQLYAHHRP